MGQCPRASCGAALARRVDHGGSARCALARGRKRGGRCRGQGVIPQADIIAWRRVAPWPDDGMVEQDLVLSRALVEIFSDTTLAHGLAFREDLHKLVLAPPSRYSEDLDFVQVEA